MKNGIKVSLGFIWVLTALSFYWFGLSSGSSSSESVAISGALKQEEQATAQQKVQPIRISSVTSGLPDSVPGLGETEQGFIPFTPEVGGFVTEADLVNRIQSSNPVIRMQAFAELLANPSQESIEAALEAYKKLLGSSGSRRCNEVDSGTGANGKIHWIRRGDGFLVEK